MKGVGTVSVGAQKFDVTFALQRRPRAEAIQPHVEQRIDYFVGKLEVRVPGRGVSAAQPRRPVGDDDVHEGRRPTSSPGGSTGELVGEAVQEQLTIELGSGDEHAGGRRASGPTASSSERRELAQPDRDHVPDVAGAGQREEVISCAGSSSVMSATAFDVTEEFSVDGGPFKRLGNARYTKVL